METPLLSRVCSAAFTTAWRRFSGSRIERGRLIVSFVWDEYGGRSGSDLLHAVLAWEGTDGARASSRRCLCGEIENPDYGERGAPP